jgi:hypothetical protein
MEKLKKLFYKNNKQNNLILKISNNNTYNWEEIKQNNKII